MGAKRWAAFDVIDRGGNKGFIWSRVGSAWLERDGSITLVLDSVPIGGRIHLREEDGAMDRAQSGALALGRDAAGEGG
jgi:hypothetical protein